MPNIKSAIKQAKKSEKRRKINLARKSDVKTAIKSVISAIDQGETIEKIKELLKEAEAKLSRAKSKKVIRKGTAERKVSRLAKRVAAVSKK